MKGLKFVETLAITFQKQSGEEKTIQTAYFNCTAQTIINKTQIELALKLSKQQILNKIGYQTLPDGLFNQLKPAPQYCQISTNERILMY